MPLNDIRCKNAKPKEKPYKMYDSEGLYLEIAPKGGKYWRFKYRFGDKEKRLSIGVYPEIGLLQARKQRESARELLRENKDPSCEKQHNRNLAILNSENSFEAVAREWHENRSGMWTPSYAAFVLKRLEADIFPDIGNRPIIQIKSPDVLAVLRRIEKRGTKDLQHRMLQICGMIFRYAGATGRVEVDPTPTLRGALRTVRREHHKYLEANDMPEFMKRLLAYDGDKTTQLALRLIILTFLRTTELRAAEWSEIDFQKAEWRIPASRMKMKELHIVPLSCQSLEILKLLKTLSHNSLFVFPARSTKLKCMSNNTMLFALYRMGYHSQATVHGFRSTASTMLNELGYRSDVIERQLSHGERNKIRAAYNHAQYLPERRIIMQGWADYLDEVIRDETNIIVGNFEQAAE